LNKGAKDKVSKSAKSDNKLKRYTLKALTEYFENKFNIDISTEEDITLKNTNFRNKYLFPSIKEGQVYNKEDIIFDELGARTYLEMLSRTLDKSDDIYMEEVPYIEFSKKDLSNNINSDHKIIIKKSSNLSTVSEAGSGGEEHKTHVNVEDAEYVDQDEVNYINKLKDATKPAGKKQNLKWVGKA